ncbi:RNase adapter RapZ [Nocardiopsis changdeensis]|uniref:RNase adapter RapZ n=1 Tax=Nocardiopsis changdeensis TaxID=2831969 RepID=A0ABX8BQT2_9ACTN|nr:MULTISPECIES: RNase adapter RapZ [Nocardiopsis]QUX24585.1 RNase adapter RapZ [Nocardiopsis changdeensis]QYX34973.1 RNase adapter RapZ [Nocardiopsis sp. MT53]
MTVELGGELPPEVVIVTGMSGAGRSTAARALEDLDWFVVDNLPPGLLPTMIELAGRTHGAVPRVAVVVDVRSLAFTEDLLSTVEELRKRDITARVLYLEAGDDALVRRFEGVRRPHPLQGDGRLTDGIARERETLRAVRGEADLVIDTSQLNVHQLKARVIGFFGESDEARPRANVVSFGFKHGLPVDADLVLDCRFLPNPHWIPELRPMNGRDEPVRDYVLSQDGAKEMLEAYSEVLKLTIEGYQREGKHYMTLAVGCTGGKHRSVAMAEQFAERLRTQGVEVHVVHRDVGRE